MRREAPGVRLVSGERIGGGVAADGMGELSKLLLGAHPAKALAIARDTGVLVELLPEFEAAIGFDQESRHHSMTVDEHTFAVVQAAADAKRSLAVRLAALFHDAGKPQVAWRGTDDRLHYYAKPGYSAKSHEQVGAALAEAALNRLRYPTELSPTGRPHRALAHDRHLAGRAAARAPAARALRRLAARPTCSTTRRPTCAGRATPRGRRPRRSSHASGKWSTSNGGSRIGSATWRSNGNDLIAIGYRPGPAIGHALRKLLDEVVRTPELNTKEQLLVRAKELPR